MAPAIVLHQLNLVSADVAASVAFYRRIGLIPREGPPEWRAHHVTLERPGGAIELELDSAAFAQRWDRGWRGGSGGRVVIGFQVAGRGEVDRLCAELAGAGHRVQQPPYDAFWGARYAVVEDPDGNPVGLMSPIDPARRTAPPAPPP